MHSQNLRTEAIILRRTNYGEADRILNLLTPEHGKLTVMARGVRRPKSKLAGGLELFATCDLTIRQGRGEIGMVTSARLVNFYGQILRDYERLRLGYDCLKRLAKVAETVAEPDFYYLLKASLEYLNELSIDSRMIALWLRLRLDSLLGAELNLTTDVNGQALSPDERYIFDIKEAAFDLNPNGQFGSDHIKLLRLISTHDPVVLQRIRGIDLLIEDCLQSVII